VTAIGGLLAGPRLLGRAALTGLTASLTELGVQVSRYHAVDQACGDPAATRRRVLEVVVPLGRARLVAAEPYDCGGH